MRVTPLVMHRRLHHRLSVVGPLRVARQNRVRFMMSTDRLLLDFYGSACKVVECEYSGSVLRGYTFDGVYLIAHLLVAALSVALVVLALALDHLLSARTVHFDGLLGAYQIKEWEVTFI